MRLSLLAVGLLVPMLLGCGAEKPTGPDRYPVSGTVTLDGKPLESGRISFDSPEDAAQGVPPVSAEIEAGKYSLNSSLGTKTVRISQKVESGQDEITKEPIMKEAIPAKFNKNSNLEVTVSDGENTANFDL